MTDAAASNCPKWCIVDHRSDLHGEHIHVSEPREVGSDSRNRPVTARLLATTTDAGDNDGPYLDIENLDVPDPHGRPHIFLRNR